MSEANRTVGVTTLWTYRTVSETWRYPTGLYEGNRTGLYRTIRVTVGDCSRNRTDLLA